MLFRFGDIHNSGRLIPRITEFSTSDNVLILKIETEHDCKVEFLHYEDKQVLYDDVDELQSAIDGYYSSEQTEPMGFQTDAVGYVEGFREEDEEDLNEEDRKIGFAVS